MGTMARALDRLNSDRKTKIFSAAEAFKKRVTR